MTKRERVHAALARRPVDRPPVAFWPHVPEVDHTSAGLAEAMLAFQRRWDLEALVGQWQKAGFKPKVQAAEWGAYFKRYLGKQFQDAYLLGLGGPRPWTRHHGRGQAPSGLPRRGSRHG